MSYHEFTYNLKLRLISLVQFLKGQLGKTKRISECLIEASEINEEIASLSKDLAEIILKDLQDPESQMILQKLKSYPKIQQIDSQIKNHKTRVVQINHYIQIEKDQSHV